MHRFGAFMLALLALVEGQGDPCLKGNHGLINQPHRSTLFVPEGGDMLLCDRDLHPGWYVFGGNEEMPTQCVQSYHCGTHAPIWMHGSNPSVQDGIVKREACINYGFPSNPIKCCNHKLPIQVKNCGTFFVYYLNRAPGCPAAYCAGSKRVCNVGSTGSASNCKDLYPKLTTFPKLGNPEVTQNNKVRFPCTIDYPKGEKDVAFEVTWTVDGHELRDPMTHQPVSAILTGDSRTTYLDVDKLQGNLDKNLRCNVTSYHPSTPGLRSDSVPSNHYFVGFKVSNDTVVVDEKGTEKTITIESTIPIPCNALNQYDCKFPIEVHQGKDPTDLSWQSCTYDLKKDPVDGKYKATIKVKATRDFINDHDKIHEIAFEPLFSLMNPVWMGYNVSHIHVRTKDANITDCTLSGDPHMRGFTHKKMYNVYQEGDFLLYGTKHNSRPFEVHVRNWGCGKYHPCSCAIVAREGNDVIEIDMCEKRMNEIAAPVLKKLSSGPLDGTTVTRDKSGKNFYINFPSGTRIEVSAHVATPKHTHEKDGYLTIHIQAPADDLGKTQGICGAWNGKPDGALEGKDGVKYTDKETNQFTSSWKLAPGTSMFEQIPKPEAHLKMGHEYCSCKAKVVDCSKGKGANNPNKRPHKSKVEHIQELDVNDHLLHPSLPYISRQVFDVEPLWVCAGGKCLAPTFVQKVTRRDVTDEYVNEYFPENVKYADGDIFTISHMNAYDMVCQTEVMKDVTRYRYSADGEPIPPTEITSGRCADQCSRHGTCIRGVCHCNHGYTSVDCSVRIGVPPQLHRIRGDGVCDIRSQKCTTVNIIAENIMDANTLLCKIQFINENGTLHREVTTKGEFINFLEVSCPVPPNLVTSGAAPAQGIKVSMTNDGKVYSSTMDLKVYDSRCYQCDNGGKCTKKADTCLINGKCYMKDEQDHSQGICDPAKNPVGWSPTSAGVKEIDHYTASYKGCACPFDTARFDCACCQNGGCPCGEFQTNQCTSCQRMDLCGKYPDLFPVV